MLPLSDNTTKDSQIVSKTKSPASEDQTHSPNSNKRSRSLINDIGNGKTRSAATDGSLLPKPPASALPTNLPRRPPHPPPQNHSHPPQIPFPLNLHSDHQIPHLLLRINSTRTENLERKSASTTSPTSSAYSVGLQGTQFANATSASPPTRKTR